MASEQHESSVSGPTPVWCDNVSNAATEETDLDETFGEEQLARIMGMEGGCELLDALCESEDALESPHSSLFNLAVEQTAGVVAAAKQYFMDKIAIDITDKVIKSSTSGRSQICLYRVNFREDAVGGWHEYYFPMCGPFPPHFTEPPTGMTVLRLLQEHDFISDLQDHYEPFEVTYEKTSRRNHCIFVSWRGAWESDSDSEGDCDFAEGIVGGAGLDQADSDEDFEPRSFM